MKKILIVLLMVFMFIPSIYAETEYKVMNLDEVLTEEEIDHDFSNYVESDDKITIYFFRGKGCKFCKAFLSFLNDIIPEYGKYFNVKAYDVWNDSNSDKLLDEVGEFLNQPSEGIPYVVIGETVFNGYTTDYDDEIKKAIVKEYNKKKRYDVLYEMNEANKEEDTIDYTPVYVTGAVVTIINLTGFTYIYINNLKTRKMVLEFNEKIEKLERNSKVKAKKTIKKKEVK